MCNTWVLVFAETQVFFGTVGALQSKCVNLTNDYSDKQEAEPVFIQLYPIHLAKVMVDEQLIYGKMNYI